jgi:hypothetical protein
MTEDIYFLTGLSRRGKPVNFRMFPSGPHNISELIGLHCEVGTDRTSSQVLISNISDLSLQAIVLLIGQITRSVDLHQESRAQMNCAVQCLNAHIFLLENHITRLYEEATNKLSVADSEELWIWNDYFLFLL